MNAKDPKPRFQSSAPDYIQDKTDKTISFTDFKSNILSKPNTTSEDRSIPESSENGIRLLRYQSTNFPSLLSVVDFPFNTSGGSEISQNLDHTSSSLKKLDSNRDEPQEHPSDSTTTSNKKMRPVRSMSAKEIRREKIRIWKNVIVISLSFLCLFTAYNSVANLQSSINSDAGLGTWSQATVYIALVFSCMFVPSWMIKTLNCKWTLVVSQLCYSVYICVQFYPSFATLIPGAVVVGFGAAPNWAAKCTYLTQAGNRYAALVGDKSAEPSVARFFGFFFMAFQTSFIWGSIISSLVLSQDGTHNKTQISDERLDFCGANFCPSGLNLSLSNDSDISGPVLERPPTDQIHFLMYIFLGFAILASIIVAVFVDPIREPLEASRNSKKSGWQLVIATARQMRNPYQMLIIPLTLWSGFQLAFLTADFTAAYITCSWGVENIGFVLIVYGVTDAIGCLVCGNLVKKIGRIPLFIYGAAMNLALIITLLLWRPDPAEPAVYFVIAALWGSADAVWQTQINSFYGVIFPAEEEAAFSNYRLWESLGFAIVFSYSTAFCIDVKLYILAGVLVVGMIGYLTIEILERIRNNREKFDQNNRIMDVAMKPLRALH